MKNLTLRPKFKSLRIAISPDHEVIVALVCTFFLMLFRVPVPFSVDDALLGLVLAKAAAFKEMFSTYDLLVHSGRQLPFFVYEFFGFFYRAHLPVERIWVWLTPLFIFFQFWSLGWFLKGFLAETKWVAPTLLVIAFIPSTIGALNWTSFPVYHLASLVFVLPLAFVVFGALFRGYVYAACVFAAVTFLLHQGLGVIVLMGFTAAALYDPETRRPFLKMVPVILLISVPALLRIFTGHTQTAAADPSYFKVYQQYSGHTYLEKHLTQGYGWFGLMIFGAAYFGRFAALTSGAKRFLLVVLFVFFAALLVYTLNLYYFHIPVIANMFLFRATTFIKPVCLGLMVAGIAELWRHRIKDSLVVHMIPVFGALTILGASVLHYQRSDLAEIAAFCGWTVIFFFFVSSSRDRIVFMVALPVALFCTLVFLKWLNGVSLFPIFADREEWSRLLNISTWKANPFPAYFLSAFNFLFGLILAFYFTLMERAAKKTAQHPTRPSLALGYIAFSFLLLFCLETGLRFISHRKVFSLEGFLQQAAGNRYVDPAMAKLIAWIETHTDTQSIFVVPPADKRFVGFRLFAERSVWGSVHDINQLGYDYSVYLEGHHRITDVGLVLKPDRENPFRASESRFYGGNINWPIFGLSRPVDYLILDRKRVVGDLKFVPIYVDDNFIVYQFPNTRFGAPKT